MQLQTVLFRPHQCSTAYNITYMYNVPLVPRVHILKITMYILYAAKGSCGSLTLACTCAVKGYCSWSVGMVCVCLSARFLIRNVAVGIPNVDGDTKCGYVGMCNGHSAQQESGAVLSKTSTHVSRRLISKVCIN